MAAVSTPEPIAELSRRPELTWDDPAAILVAATAAGAGPPVAWPGDEAALLTIRRGAVRLIELPAAELLARLDDVLRTPRPDRALKLLAKLGAVAVLLPEVAALEGFHRSADAHHKDLWDHTCRVVAHCPVDVDLRWAALMHDIGKIATRQEPDPDRVTFYGHERLGAWLCRGVAARLAMPAERADRIAFVVEHHGRVNAYETDWSDRAVRRLMREGGERLDDLLAFSRADFTTRREDKRARIRAEVDDLERRIAQLRREDRAPQLPSGLGNVVRERAGLQGPAIGEAMRWLQARLEAGDLDPDAPAEAFIGALRERDQKG